MKGAFCNAIRKYGEECFEWKVLDTVNDIDELNARETYYIAAYETLAPKGYNIQFGGGNRRIPLSVRKKISEGKKGEKNPMFGMTGEKSHNFGRKHTEEVKKKNSMAQKGVQAGEKNPMFGKTGEKNPQFDKTVYTFEHDVYGITTRTQYDLRMQFNLDQGRVSRLVNGKCNSVKGWRMAGNI